MANNLQKLKQIRLIFDCKCLIAVHENQIYFLLGDYFNLKNDLINKKECKYICVGCRLEIIIDFNKIFISKQIN